MKLITNCFCLVNLASALAYGQQSMDPEISGTSANHTLSWNSTSNYFYSVDCSLDLQSWTWTGIESAGTGNSIMYGFSSNAEKLFYRIRATVDSNDGGFLVLPQTNDEFDEIDGVCFAFDLNQFTNLPAKICLFEREYNNPSDQWEQIGVLINPADPNAPQVFDEIDGIKFVRGSAVWLAKVRSGQNETEYEVQATVKDATGLIIASAIRQITVGKNQAPVVQITGGPPSPSATAEPAIFTATVEDSDGDTVRRVEFYDNGVFIGTDSTATATGNPNVFEFGDDIVDREGVSYNLLRLDDVSGTSEDESIHKITARAFDSRLAIGDTTNFYPVKITNSTVNARPEIEVTNAPSGRLVVAQAVGALTINYSASDPDGISEITEIEAYDLITAESESSTVTPAGSLIFNTTSWELGTHTLRIVARDAKGDESYPLYLEVYVSSGLAETLAANIVDGSSATVVADSERFVGVEASSGVFTLGENSGLEIDNGALFTTGSFILWNGGDDADGSVLNNVSEPIEEDNMDEYDDPNIPVDGSGFNEEPGDPELEDRVTGTITFDAAVLEFDAYCANGQLEMDYQFGSEEYPEWVGDFNDGFMVTIDGVLVTLVPDCSDIVAVNSVNDDDPINEHLYLDDNDDIDPNVTPANQAVQVEYDGMTIRLRVHAFFEPETTHRIRLVIGDVTDDQFDSGLFIGESSVRTINPQQ